VLERSSRAPDAPGIDLSEAEVVWASDGP